MSIHLEIGGVDYSAYIRELDLEPSGPGKIGTGALHLSVPGSAITDRQTVKVWRVDGGGLLVRRYFGGYVGGAGTGRLSVTPTKTWDIPLQDYSLAGKRLVADVDLITDSGTALAAETFANQVGTAVRRWQEMNGTPSVYIDAVSKVVNLTGATVLPAIAGLNGKSLDFVLQQICNNARVVTPALRPRWRWGYDNTFGVGAVFGPPVLWVYNAADVTSTVAHFSDASNNIIIGTYKRTTQSPALVNRRQAVYGDPVAVVTSLGTVSHSTYPFDLAGDGYWSDESLEDKDSTNSTQAQAVIDRNRQATEFPRETIELSSRTWAEPGETVLVTWAGDGLAAVGYRVAGVRLTFLKGDADTPICAYTLGQVPREVGVDDGDTIGNPPVVGDHVGPGRPTALGGTSVYDGASHTSPLSGTFIAPLDSDYEYTELRYRQRLNGGTYGAWAALTRLTGDPGATQTYTIPGLTPSSPGNTWETYVVPQAYDHNHNGSAFGTNILVPNASVDAPGPPTSLTYVTRYSGNGTSEATVSYTAGTGGGTRAYYLWELTPPNGPVRIQRGQAAATTVTFKDLVPGQVYSAVGTAYTVNNDPGAPSSAISLPAARMIIPLPDPVPGHDSLDGDKSATFSRDYTPSHTGSGTDPTRDLTTVFAGQSTWKLPVGSSAGTALVSGEWRKAVAPGDPVSWAFIEGNCGAAQGTVELLIQPRDSSDAPVGSEIVAYSAVPSTAPTGTPHAGKEYLPTTSTIRQVSLRLRYTGDGTHARTVYVTAPQFAGSVPVTGLALAPTSDVPLTFAHPDAPTIPRGDVHVTPATYGGTPAPARWTLAGNRDPGDGALSGDTYITWRDTFGNLIQTGPDGWSYAAIGTHVFDGHVGTLGAAPAPTVGAGAGTGATVTLYTGATDTAGQIRLLTGSGVSTGVLVRITYAAPYTAAPLVFHEPGDEATMEALLRNGSYTIVQSTATYFDLYLTTSATPLADTTYFVYKYRVIGTPT